MITVTETAWFIKRAEKLLPSEENPVFLFDIFGKNEKSNISDNEKNELYKIIQELKKGLKS